MRHYSCDQCGKALDPDTDGIYVVRIDVEVMPSAVRLTPAEVTADSVEAMAEWLEAHDGDDDDTAVEGLPTPVIPEKAAYELCLRCARRFSADPLGLDRRGLHYSAN